MLDCDTSASTSFASWWWWWDELHLHDDAPLLLVAWTAISCLSLVLVELYPTKHPPTCSRPWSERPVELLPLMNAIVNQTGAIIRQQKSSWVIQGISFSQC